MHEGRHRFKILVVDDKMGIRNAVRDRLQSDLRRTTHVITAGDGAGVVELVEEERPDLILLDLGMPTSGHQVLEDLEGRGLLKGTEVIIFSNYATYQELLRTVRHGARDFVDKGNWREELVPRVRLCLDNIEDRLEARQLREDIRLLAASAGHDIAGGYQIGLTDCVLRLQRVAEDHPDIARIVEDLDQRVEAVVAYGRSLSMFAQAYLEGIVPETSEILEIGELLSEQQDLVFGHDSAVVVSASYGECLHVEGDRKDLEHLFFNLLENARKSLDKRMEVSIEALVEEDAWVVVRILDSGSGFPKRILDAPFRIEGEKRSEWRNPEMTGTGFGLPFCGRIANRHGGELLLENIEKDSRVIGAAVEVRLPLAVDGR